MNLRRTSFFLILLLHFASCDMPECKSNNPVFVTNAPESHAYKAELLKALQRKDLGKIRYWIDGYFVDDRQEFMTIYIQANNLCAKGILDISNNNRLDNFRSVKGVSYHGAGLGGLKYHIDSSGADYHFIFDDVSRIID